MTKSDFLTEFKERGFFAQATHENELDEILATKKITAYIGFDCTATSLHVGSLIQIMILRLLQKHGHKPLILLGGGTTKIGDPTGKDEARKVLSEEQIQENLSGIKKTLEKFVSFEGENKAEIVNNDDWLKNLNYLEFLSNVGRHFSINRMLTFDSVKTRLEREQPLSFLEFNYMILQAYDFYYLNKEKNCILQIGGSDQWGNIVNGVELTRKKNAHDFNNEIANITNKFIDLKRLFPKEEDIKVINYFYKWAEEFKRISELEIKDEALKEEQKNTTKLSEVSKFNSNQNLVTKINTIISDFTNTWDNIKNKSKSFGLTSPLLTTADGKKMGKTADGAVWLDETMLSPFDYFQYFRNVDDRDVIRFLKLFTDLSLEQISEFEKLEGQEINKAKEILAFEATKICHGIDEANNALTKAKEIFIAKNTESFEEKEVFLNEDGNKKLTEIIREIGASESNSQSKKLIEGKAVKINDEVIFDINRSFSSVQSFNLAVGKKKFFKVIIK